jgi:hypothetical protein
MMGRPGDEPGRFFLCRYPPPSFVPAASAFKASGCGIEMTL